ncbi:Stealth CR1 domain-containing protein [Streptococcus hyointestinalis]|uniref:stealth family protein n=1 Tax=Streptococcus hyointestinalis TaxID=1337 RepID=UPI003CFDB3DA
MKPIDFVVTWVNGNDPKWRKSKNKYQGKSEDLLNTEDRYRDWDFLRYWFRAVEKNTPWVNKIFFITEGHLPEWLDVDNKKLRVVKHSDYIPNEYLPTFNSNVIELNLVNIKELSDNFVLFNDDMFINSPISPSYFFENDTPKDTGVFSPLVPTRGGIASTCLNNIEVINDYFNMRQVLKSEFSKIFNLKYGKYNIKNICVLPWNKILGFYDTHIPVSYNKSSFETIWSCEATILKETSSHKFRTKDDVNHWLVRYWQICSGNFVPKNINKDKYYNISDELPAILEDIRLSKHNLICLNDGDNLTSFEEKKQLLLEALESKFGKKSTFEKW